ncbi:putative pectinesterase 52 [Prosopis cineraria]|uniref:putative pectinesterase 52 n=1 Tax=Prosopis cineraria TaxID=364024 RepID=UPI00240EC9B6|nr:putative pectinesterase 52 [Prosopis cineraria]
MNLVSGQIVMPLFVFLMIFQCYFSVGIAEDCGGKEIAYSITVGQSGKFKTVQAAVDSISRNNARWVKIHIHQGKYLEKVQIPKDKPCILLEGEGRRVTTITYNDHQQTDTSATFTSFPNNVIVVGITFENSFDLSTESRLEQNARVVPALATRIYGDRSAFLDCGFLGFQDTLWDVQGRHYFKNCYIQGAVDFIFGNGQSYFENCYVNVTLSTRSSVGVPWGCITAQGRRSEKEASGFVFGGGRVVGTGPVLLGRAYGPYSRVIFHGTFLDSLVSPQGWDAWHYTQHKGNLMYAEVGCEGPGATLGKRVPWETKLSASKLNHQFSKSSFINQDGWLANLPN